MILKKNLTTASVIIYLEIDPLELIALFFFCKKFVQKPACHLMFNQEAHRPHRSDKQF